MKTATAYVVMCEVADVAFPVATCAHVSDAEHIASSLTKSGFPTIESAAQRTKSFIGVMKLSSAIRNKNIRYWVDETIYVVDSEAADVFAESTRRAIALVGGLEER